jgi:hypothetical protein
MSPFEDIWHPAARRQETVFEEQAEQGADAPQSSD